MERDNEFNVPVLGFAAYSGTGKTSLLVKLLPLMKLQGLSVATIKQTHHDFSNRQTRQRQLCVKKGRCSPGIGCLREALRINHRKGGRHPGNLTSVIIRSRRELLMSETA